MKFWKISILATVILCGIIITILYTACEKNICDNVTCQHGGSCNAGTCRCPTGYEGTQCQALATDRYVGIYAGYTQCDELSRTIDTVRITTTTTGILNVDLKMLSLTPKILHGVISSNASTYSVLISNNDTTLVYDAITKMDTLIHYKTYTVTLQDDTLLKVQTYETFESPSDSTYHKCTFQSIRKLALN